MNSSNLALVFGPTLVQAPTHLEALQLHNDVPAVNVLIQVCIEQHDVIFPSTAVTPPPPPVADEPRSQSVSPPLQVTPPEVSAVVFESLKFMYCFNSFSCTCLLLVVNKCTNNTYTCTCTHKHLIKEYYN